MLFVTLPTEQFGVNETYMRPSIYDQLLLAGPSRRYGFHATKVMITGSLSKIPSCFYSDVFCILLAIIIVLSWIREDIVSASRRTLKIFYADSDHA
jgi:hypothetical protein